MGSKARSTLGSGRLVREPLFQRAEDLAKDFKLFPSPDADSEFRVRGLLSAGQIERHLADLRASDIDAYVEKVVAPAEQPDRPSAAVTIPALGKVISNIGDGPYYHAIVEMEFSVGKRQVGFLAQDRRVRNGEWMPEHHLAATHFVEECSRRSYPIVSLMDTPGASGEEAANSNHQAHSISRLIATMSDVGVPNLGVIFGLGYSGGAIPLAASNLILSVRDGVFSTIQPRSLANIARRLNLSWQECAKLVGLSPYELLEQGNIDGIIDYVPGETEKLSSLAMAIVSGIESIEQRVIAFVSANHYIVDHYVSTLDRFLSPSDRLKKMVARASLGATPTATEYPNVFGVAYRFSRYLRVRRRIKATNATRYGRLAEQQLPAGELTARAERERRRTFLRWLQDPDVIVYDDRLLAAWKNFEEKREAADLVRGRIGKILLGEPRRNFQLARERLLGTLCLYLYNRWKTDSPGNLASLVENLRNHADSKFLFLPSDIANTMGLLDALHTGTSFATELRERFTHDGRKLVAGVGRESRSIDRIREALAVELNMALTEGPFKGVRRVAAMESQIEGNRKLVEGAFGEFLHAERPGDEAAPDAISVLDVLRRDELRSYVLDDLCCLQVFDIVYDCIVGELDAIAEEAGRTQKLSEETLARIIDLALQNAQEELTLPKDWTEVGKLGIPVVEQKFYDWYTAISALPKARNQFTAIEEWKRGAFPQLSETLFVVITHLFERLLASFLKTKFESSKYDGRIAPRNIGRKKDFWNRLQIAYRDLRIQRTLDRFKRGNRVTHSMIVKEFFEDFEELYSDLLSSDPRQFPGFRVSIQRALDTKTVPCGVVTGIGSVKTTSGAVRMGAVISNIGFQAGAFDMASAEKFCRLLVKCADEQIPVVCFISSGGMQTKEGAGALFSMAAINDRITRFVRDFDLPLVVFGFGDCTGGAQASFVTHPLVHTYYFSGTSMPFAGQIVIPSHLPLRSILSNYLATDPNAMEGLVKHPFHTGLDDELVMIDPEIPVPSAEVREVLAQVMAGVFGDEGPVPRKPKRKRYLEAELYRPTQRVLVHARGCAASKIVRVAQDNGLEVVLVQSDPDMDSVAVDLLDERGASICIGGNTPDESYLNALSVMAVAENERVDCLHPGIGFLSESSQFARLVRSRGINFIGPPVSSMETMGNKSNAIKTALAHGVPVVPGSHGVLTDAETAESLAREIGFPVLIKAVHGGGGKGIQVVESANEFVEQFQRVSAEARLAFGNGDVYLEKCVTSLRHIEVQVLRDCHGNTKVVGIRDCSVQRNKQKVIEESGSTMLPDELCARTKECAASLAEAVGYVGAGTVEFIYDLKAGEVYFMEMNTRLQVEHPVTELVAGVDIVGEQFRIASGEAIADLTVGDLGYAIEARVNAERIVRGSGGQLEFRPSPGHVSVCKLPQSKGISVIAATGTDKFVSPFYDSMIVQVIAHGADRDSTAKKLYNYLGRVEIEGIRTNIALVRRVLKDEVFLGGNYDTNFLPEFLERTDADAVIGEIERKANADESTFGVESISIEGSDELKVLAPSTGIFYLKPTPAEPDYVSEGDVVDAETTLCQLEAFKIFAPLKLKDLNPPGAMLYRENSEFTVTRVNVSTGQQVSEGDLLFVVCPSDGPAGSPAL